MKSDSPERESSANKISLIQAKNNYSAIGACHPDAVDYVRRPIPEEISDK